MNLRTCLIWAAFLMNPAVGSATVATASGLLVIKITTADGKDVLTKNYVRAQLSTVSASQLPWVQTHDVEIKVRGNSTADFPKKPYKIRLARPAPLLGLPADTTWTLIANYSDKTLMRNLVAFEISRRLGMAYTPRTRIVEVEMNNRPQGTYVLTEQIRISSSRVPAPATDLTGGYLLELDRRRDAKNQIVTRRLEPYAIHEPARPSSAQIDYIEDYLNQAEAILYSDGFSDPVNGYAKYIDVDSFIDWYLVNEIMKSPDAGNFSSIYFFKASGRKLAIGPVWDFDIAAGNIAWKENNPTSGWWVRRRSPWFKRLFADPAFEQRARTRWQELKRLGADKTSLMKFIDETAVSLDESQRRNFLIWPILDVKVWPNRFAAGSYQGEVDYLKSWLSERMDWLDAKFSSPSY